MIESIWMTTEKLATEKLTTEKKFVLGDTIGAVELIRHSGSDLDIVNAARVSFGSTHETVTERDTKLIRYLLQHNHTSPFEHNQISYRITCPLFVARQWMRHRIGVSYNEISYRYVESPLEFYIPQKFRAQSADNKQASEDHEFQNEETIRQRYQDALDSSAQAYKDLLEQGVAREIARAVLPSATYTHFIFTCNLVSLMHFIKLREHPGAQWEIQQYAIAMREFIQPTFSASFAMWEDTNRHAF